MQDMVVSENENLSKELLLGSSKNGKTAILSRFLHGSFPHRHRITTQEIFREQIQDPLFCTFLVWGGPLDAGSGPRVVDD